MNAKFGRKKNKTANISSDAITNDQIPSSSPIQAGASSLTGQSVTQSFKKTADEILTPEMNDIEKLQKIKEWILQDQHPYFNSAPKVAHLLSLRVSGAEPSSSGSVGDRETDRPISSIPLAERLSSPRSRLNGDFHDSQEANEGMSIIADDPSTGQTARHGGQSIEKNVDPNAPATHEDVDMAEPHVQEPTGPALTPTHPTGRGMPYPRAHNQWKQERYPPGADFDGRRHPGDDPMRRPPSPNGRYDRHYDRFETGTHAPGYYQQNNRRFSYNDRQQRNYGGDRDYPNQGNYAPRFQDDRRMDERGYTRPMGGPKTQNFHAGRGNYERRSEDPKSVYGTNQQHPQHTRDDSFEQPKSSAGLESHPVTTSEHEDEKDAIKTEPIAPTLETKVTPVHASPVSPAVAPSQSGTESVPAPPSVKSETPQDVPFAPAQDEKMSEENHSPRADVSVTGGAAEESEIKQSETEQANRPKYYPHRSPMGRPRMNPYNKYQPQEHHGYDRSLPPRDDRNFERKEPYQRPGHTHPYPNNDRRFVPREAAYLDDPPYASRREFPPQNWNMKRRDDELSFTKPFDYDRGRDFRAGGDAMPPRDLPPRDMRDTRKGPPMGGARAYDVPHEFSRRMGSRSPPRALSPPGFRAYDRDYYAAPPPQAMAPMPGSYSREVPRIRPRSMSPLRRDLRAEERPPPTKRVRGPVGTYPANAASGGHYGYPNQTMPNSRPHDYTHERRPIPAGPAAGAGPYYRNDNRGPMARY